MDLNKSQALVPVGLLQELFKMLELLESVLEVEGLEDEDPILYDVALRKKREIYECIFLAKADEVFEVSVESNTYLGDVLVAE